MQGMDDTDIRAGVIGEIGVSEFFSELEHKVLMAAAMAHEKTGQAISVHINPWTTHGVEAAKLLLKANVPPEKICICHVDVENRRPYIQELLDLGVFIEFDNFGKEYFVQRSARRFGYGTFVTDIQRVVLLRELVDKGYEHQILLSCDVCLKTLLHAYGGWGYDHLLRNILPMAIAEGISQKQLDVMIVDNPGRFLDTND
jgi:phosphotriesterase-related protein